MASKSQTQLITLAVLLVGVVWVCSLTPPLAVVALRPSNCSDKCGDVTIPYPFGMSDGCYLDEDFLITCNTASYNPPQPFLRATNINVTEISFNGELHVLKYRGIQCYSDSGNRTREFEPSLTLVKHSINDTLNKFVVVGCDSYGYLSGKGFTTGCMSMCNKTEDVDNGTCNGVGCCQTSIPKNMLWASQTVGSFNNHKRVSNFNPCTFAFLIEDKKFKFSRENLKNLQDVEKLPMVLAWSIGNKTCEEAKKDKASYACIGNSTCYDMPDGYSGYRCSCWDGYDGNPYLPGPDGCQDINECERLPNECTFPDKKYCKNTVGNYTCFCPKGYSGAGRGKDGCKKNQNMTVVYIVVGVVVSFVAVFVTVSWLQYLKWRKQKFNAMRDKNYQDNGGLTLDQKIKTGGNTLNNYTEKEVRDATNNFNESYKLGEGSFGTVYQGMLRNQLVAIKKSELCSEINYRHKIELFINELVVLSGIRHQHVVKLLGCCLDTEIPMLVYEFVGNKTLSSHLRADTAGNILPWKTRLKIATEASDALFYLHSNNSPPILHGDIKLENIQLDQSLKAKVADLGSLRLIPLDQTEAHSLLVQVARGYVDPEFLQSSQLTEKSDVYSFGVVLAELLTGRTAIFKDGDKVKTLANYFVFKMGEGRGDEIFDTRICRAEHLEQLREVANLVKRCLSLKGDDRPTMRNVFHELEKINNQNSGSQAARDE